MRFNFKQRAKSYFNSEDGLFVLAALKAEFVDTSVFCESERATMYKLGQKELIEGLIKTLNEPEVLENIIANVTEED